MVSSYPAGAKTLPIPPESLLGWVLPLCDTGQLCLRCMGLQTCNISVCCLFWGITSLGRKQPLIQNCLSSWHEMLLSQDFSFSIHSLCCASIPALAGQRLSTGTRCFQPPALRWAWLLSAYLKPSWWEKMQLGLDRANILLLTGMSKKVHYLQLQVNCVWLYC